MKNLKEFILEGKKHVDKATVADFYKWAICGNDLKLFNEIKNPQNDINSEDFQGLLDNGWFDYFEDIDEIKDWFVKNWTKKATITSIDTPNDYEVSIKVENNEYTAAFMNPYGIVDEY